MFWVSVISALVTIICVTGLVAHFMFMKKRTRLDDSRTELVKILEEHESHDEKYHEAYQVYEKAASEYNGFISRGPGAVIAYIVGLGREEL